jgi:hypothetical protein
MVCGYCSREQAVAAVCIHCGKKLASSASNPSGRNTRFWEGGQVGMCVVGVEWGGGGSGSTGATAQKREGSSRVGRDLRSMGYAED